MKFDGLNHNVSAHAALYLAWLACADEDEVNAEIARFNEMDHGPISMAEHDGAEIDVGYLTNYVTFYLDQDEAGRMVEQDRYEAICCGSDQTYVLAKTMRSMERNFTHWTVNMQRMANDQLEATETIADAMPYIYRGIDDLTEAVRDK